MLAYEYQDETIELRRARERFRNVFFGNRDGLVVFEFLLRDLGTFSSTPDPSATESALRAYGMKLLEYAGVNHEAVLPNLIQMLSNLPSFGDVEMEEENEQESD